MKIFISRKLKANSPFVTKLPKEDFEIIDESLLSFSAVAIEAIPVSDWVFFYSKNAVRFSLENESFKKEIFQRKIAVMGKGTAKGLSKYNLKADFVGAGSIDEIASNFSKLVGEQIVLFPQAKKSRQSIQKKLPDSVKSISLVVYENNIKSDFEIPKVDCLIFTSPLNAKAYYQKYPINNNQKVLAIGPTTAKALRKIGLEKILVAKEPSEKALVTLLKS